MKNKRKSNIELLRIILIIMIIVLHYFNEKLGGYFSYVHAGSISFYFAHILESLSIVAVNVFVLITGYFSVNKYSINISKVLRLVLIMIFWGLVLSTITVFFLDPQNINLSLIFKIFKSATNQWFVIIYCILYMLIPFLNKLIKNINQKEYKVLLLIGLFFFYFWPSFYTKVTVNDGGYGIVNFIYLYFIGAYIRKYCKNSNTISKSLVLYLGCALVVALISFKADRAWDYCFIFNLLGSIALFRLFKSIKISYNIVINKLAKYTFSVYLIDTNEFFGKFLYRNLFHSNQYWNSNKMFINLIISVFGIYIICLILEILRRLILKEDVWWVVYRF